MQPDHRNTEVSEEAIKVAGDAFTEGRGIAEVLEAAAPILQREERERIREALVGLVDKLRADAKVCRVDYTAYNRGRDSAYENAAYRLEAILDSEHSPQGGRS